MGFPMVPNSVVEIRKFSDRKVGNQPLRAGEGLKICEFQKTKYAIVFRFESVENIFFGKSTHSGIK